MSRFWTDTVRRLTPYVPGEQRQGDGIVKLNTNENPYPPSPEVFKAIAAVTSDELRRYPDPESTVLCQTLADYHGLDLEEVFVGNGSDEILALSFLGFFTGGPALQYPAVSYSFYPVYCDLYDIPQRPIPLTDKFEIQLDNFAVNDGCIIFPNPNAPTGRALSRKAIRTLLERHTEYLVVVDEAYIDFGAQSAIPLIKEFPNLLVSQTFSKGRSLAGMRIGAAFAQAPLIEGLKRVKNSFNSYPIDVLAQRAAVASLNDDDYFRQTVSAVVDTRTECIRELQLRGFDVLPSAANFVFARPSKCSAQAVFESLNKQNILVRYWSREPIAEWLRISIGTPQEMVRMFAALDALVS